MTSAARVTSLHEERSQWEIVNGGAWRAQRLYPTQIIWVYYLSFFSFACQTIWAFYQKEDTFASISLPSFTFDIHSGRPCILQCKVKYMLGQFNGPRSSWIEGSARSLNHCIVGTFQTNVICCLLRMPREKILHSSAAWLESNVGTLFL